MRMKNAIAVCGFVLGYLAGMGMAFAAPPSHEEYVDAYVGTASCTKASCHEGAAREVAQSLHYQQRAVPLFLEGWEAGKSAGMMESY